MGSLVKKSFDLLVSSDPSVGAVNRSAGGGRFQIVLDGTEGFGIPQDCQAVELQTISAELWYNTPNITVGKNAEFAFGHLNQAYSVTLPTGLYSLTQLNLSIDREIIKLLGSGASGLFSFQADEAQGKVDITIKNTGDQIDFTIPNSFNELLGYDVGIYKSTVALQVFTGQRVARFSNLAYYLIQTNMADEGLQINGSSEGIIAKVLITAKPSSQLLYQPPNPAIIDVTSTLRGNKNKVFTFTLLDNSKNEVDTLGEFWSAQIRVSYTIIADYS